MANGQQELLSLIGISSPGSDILFDGSAIAAGYHLRWSFLPDLGFPPQGFRVERRLYSSGEFRSPQEFQLIAELILPQLSEAGSSEELDAALSKLFNRVIRSRNASFAQHYQINTSEFGSLIISLENSRNLSGDVISSSRHPHTQLSTLDLILMASLDPYVARILGLYYIDSSIILGTPVDYKITGLWGLQSWPQYTVSFNQSLDNSLTKNISTGYFSVKGIEIFSEFAASIAEQQNFKRLQLAGAGGLSLHLTFPQTVREVNLTFSDRVDSDDWLVRATNEAGENISRINLRFRGTRVRIRTFVPCKQLQFTARWHISEIRVYHLRRIEYRHSYAIGNHSQIIRFNALPGVLVQEREYFNMPSDSKLDTPQVESLREMSLPSRLNENGQVITRATDVELLVRQSNPEENESNPQRSVRLHVGYKNNDDSVSTTSEILTTSEPIPWPIPKLLVFWTLDDSLKAENRNITLVSRGQTYFTESRQFPNGLSLPYIDRRRKALSLYTFPNQPSHPVSGPGYLELSNFEELSQLGTHLFIQLWVLPTTSPINSIFTLVGNNYSESFWLALDEAADGYRILFNLNNAFSQIRTEKKIPVNEWSHISVKYDGESITFFVNGQLFEIFETRRGKVKLNSRNTLCIGCDSPVRSGQFSYPFRGYLADVQIWTSIYPAPSIENPNFLAGWLFDGDTVELKTSQAISILGTPIYEQDHPQSRDRQVLILEGNTFLELRDRPELFEPNLPLTFQAWIKPDAEQAGATLIGNNQFQSYWLGLRADIAAYRLTLEINGQRYESDIAILADYWSHITVSVDRQEIVFYINGKHSNTEAVNISRISPNPDLFICIGADARSEPIRSRNPYRGKLADLNIWATVPSAPSPALIIDKAETRAEQLETPIFQQKFGELRAAWRLDGGLADTKTGRYLATKVGNRLGYEIGHPYESQRRVLKLNGRNAVEVRARPLEFYSFGNQLTLRAWVNPNSFNSEEPESQIMTIISNDRTTSFALGLEWLRAGYRLCFSLNGRDFRSSREIPPEQWSRLQVSYDGEQIAFQAKDINARILLLESQVARLNLIQTNGKRVLRIGSELSEEVFQVESAFRGKLADVEIWNRLPDDREDPENTIPDDLSDLVLPADYIAHQMPDGTYNFWAQGIDIFGRVSKRSSNRRIALNNRRKPPAPGATKASFLSLVGEISAVDLMSSVSDSSSLAELKVRVETIRINLSGITTTLLTRRYDLENRYVLEGGYDVEVVRPRPEELEYADIANFEIDAIEVNEGGITYTVTVPPFQRLSEADTGNQFTIAYDYQLRVSWTWTGVQRLFSPDVDGFRVYQKLSSQSTWLDSEDNGITVQQTVIEPSNSSVPLIPQLVSRPEWASLQGNNPDQRGVRWLPEPLPDEPSDTTTSSTDKRRTAQARLLKVTLPNQARLEEVSYLMPVQSPSAETFVSGALVAYNEAEGAQTWLHYQVLWHKWNDQVGWTLYFVQPQPNKQSIPDDDTSTSTSGAESPLPRLRYARYYPGQRYVTEMPLSSVPDFGQGSSSVGTITYDIGVTAVATHGDDVLESEIGGTATAVAVNRRRPPSPPRPEVSIDRADYYGKSRSTVLWPSVGAGISYQLYRAVDSAIVARDLEQRRLSQSTDVEVQQQNPGYVGMSPEQVFELNPGEWAFETWLRVTFNFKQFEDRERRRQFRALVANWQTQLFVPKPPDLGRNETPTPGHIAWQFATEVWQAWAERFYPALTVGEFAEIAQNRGNETAFTLLNSAPIVDMTLERDLEHRRFRTGPYQDFSPEEVFRDDPRFIAWLESTFPDFLDDWQTRLFRARRDIQVSIVWENWAERFYGDLPEDQVIELSRANGGGNKTRYIDTVNGTVRNRYLYRLRTQTESLMQSTGWGPVSEPQQAPQTRPPRAPVFTKVEAGDRQITLHWALNREPDFKEYRLYRVMLTQEEIERAIANLPPGERETPQQREVVRERIMATKKSELEDLRWWEDDLPSKQMRVISDPRIVVHAGSIRFPGNLSIGKVLGVYDVDHFDTSLTRPDRQRFTLNYYNPSPAEPSQASVFTPSPDGEADHRIDNLRRVADGKALVVVYKDRERNVRYVVKRHDQVPFVDQEISDLKNYYYYCLVAVNEANYPSHHSKIMMAMPIEGSLPEPIEIQEVSWQPVSGELGLSITWIAREDSEIQILRKNSKSNRWKVIQDWIDASAGSFIEMNSEPYFDNEVIMKTRLIGGRLTSDSAIEAIAAYPY